MAGNLSHAWIAKFNHMCRLEGVHKWEKRWVSKGNMMVFKWVRKAERCEFKGENANGEGDVSVADQAAAAEVGQQRTTRGKAAAMGIVVEKISDTNVIPDVSVRKPIGTEAAAPAAAAGDSTTASGEGGEGGGSRKRQREDAVAETEEEGAHHETETMHKKARVRGEISSDSATNTQGEGEGGDEQGTVQRDATDGAGGGLAAEEAST